MKTVIIADEIYSALKKEGSFLDRSYIRLLKASSNGGALSLHRAERADLIIAMFESSDIDGETLCNSIRDDTELNGVSIILVCRKSVMERCLSSRANAFLGIPVNTAVLLEEAYKLLTISGRKSVRVSVAVSIEGYSKKISFTGQTINVSTSGMLLESESPLDEGDTVKCSFSLPGAPRMTLDAEVVRVEQGLDGKKRYGLSFIDAPEKAGSSIEKFVGSRGTSIS